MFSLEGKNALVTGATGGIGEAIARSLHAQGATVSLSGTRAEKLEALAADLGERAYVTPANLSDRAAVDALLPAAEEKMGSVDILVNNAGITRDNLAMRMKDEEWSDVLKVNLEAAFRLSRAAARPMMKARFGRIVSITSIVGATGNPGQANYAAAKAGLVGMARSITRELGGRGITANVVAPGYIAETEFFGDALTDERRRSLIDAAMTKRAGAPADIAETVWFLASPGAGQITGQTFAVNGGEQPTR